MALEIVVITGMSGSGKSVALHALEDAGYYCVDNLPPELLSSFVALEHTHHGNRVAIAMDVRSATALPLVPRQLALLREQGVQVQSLFLDATTDTLVRRFSETRRRHPLSKDELRDGQRALLQTIELERELLAELRETSHVIDTSAIRASQLQSYVFDVRMLPNPHYEPQLRNQTGKDAPVAAFLRQQPEVLTMLAHIEQFLDHWLQALAHNHRSYVTVAIGCTGGQHRSVYLVEQLAEHFASRWNTLRRHRELDGR
jgi:UPF0042 nucleotide-binding protein